ncbi:hypothetical protein [Paraburkholderia sp.]|uniref:hypothetical protein n=1 Tax=Paraburkholderia sp. TaxID=1926495 RepID=UPI0039E3C929
MVESAIVNGCVLRLPGVVARRVLSDFVRFRAMERVFALASAPQPGILLPSRAASACRLFRLACRDAFCRYLSVYPLLPLPPLPIRLS